MRDQRFKKKVNSPLVNLPMMLLYVSVGCDHMWTKSGLFDNVWHVKIELEIWRNDGRSQQQIERKPESG